MEFLKSRKKVGYVFASLLLGGVLTSCGGSNEVEVRTPFEETGNYSLTVERKKNGNPQAGMGDLFTKTAVQFEVTSSGPAGLDAKWNYGPTTLEGAAVQISQEEQTIINIYEGMRFDLHFEAEKGNLSLNNFNQVRNQLEQMFFKVYGKDSIAEGSEMYNRIKDMFNSRAGTDQDLLDNFFPEIPLAINVIGKRFKHGDTYVKDSIQSPYGANYLMLVTSIEIENEEVGPVVYKVDSIRSEEIDLEMQNYMKAMFGDRANEIPMDQFPKSKYQSTTIIELNEDQKLRFLENEQLFSNGEGDRINSVSILIEKD